jgi:rubrerythrin
MDIVAMVDRIGATTKGEAMTLRDQVAELTRRVEALEGGRTHSHPVRLVDVKWVCRHCGHRHRWRWPEYDVRPGPSRMVCDTCGLETELMAEATTRGAEK